MPIVSDEPYAVGAALLHCSRCVKWIKCYRYISSHSGKSSAWNVRIKLYARHLRCMSCMTARLHFIMGRRHPPEPDRKTFDPFFLGIWVFDSQHGFYLMVKGLNNDFFHAVVMSNVPLGWSVKSVNLVFNHGILPFVVKICFTSYIIIIRGQIDPWKNYK